LGELEQWRRALEGGESVPAATIKHIRTLERELARKEKALAEAAALLVLKKKLQGMDLLDEDEDDDESNEKGFSPLSPRRRPPALALRPRVPSPGCPREPSSAGVALLAGTMVVGVRCAARRTH